MRNFIHGALFLAFLANDLLDLGFSATALRRGHENGRRLYRAWAAVECQVRALAALARRFARELQPSPQTSRG